MADTDGPDEAELEEMIRKLRPHPFVTALKVLAVIAGIVTVFALIIAQTLLADRSIPTGSPDAAVPETGDEEFAVMTTIDPEIRFDPPLRAVAAQTVTVRAEAPGGNGQTFGSGFLIADGVVVSAAHVVPAATDGATFPVRVFCGEREVIAGVTVYDALRDVMVIEAPECRADTLVFDDRRLGVDDTLHVAGFMFLTDAGPLAYRFHRFTSAIPTAVLRPSELRADPDILARVREMRRQRVDRYRALSGAAIPGNSGSPVFDDRGRIVGMLVIRDVLHDRSYMVPASTILWVLRANGILP
ncbi:MAG TPA: trypsin-like peptidase domain-containing protein, partial [Candidatus Eisenbacteria bacterium]|nr:trypsin-like peptidase domain-containing protein [Candidatus Eisenbacteria bacterium]